MKKLIVVLSGFLLFSSAAICQEYISGKSKETKFILSPEYKRGLPPILFVELNFEDKNNNRILEAEETSILNLIITNKGKGPAQGLQILVKDSIYDPAMNIQDGINIPFLYPGQSINVEVPIIAGKAIRSEKHKLTILVKEYFKYNMDTAYLYLYSKIFQEPKLVFSGLDIVDVGEGTGAIIEDGQLQAGEQVKVKLVVQNIGNNVSPNTRYSIKTASKNIYLLDTTGNLGDIAKGEVKEFWVTISPNKEEVTKGYLPIFLNLENDFDIGDLKEFQLPIRLNSTPPRTEIMEVKPDIEISTTQDARFEYKSKRIIANIGNVINIQQVPPSKTNRPDAIAIVIGIENYKYSVRAPYASNDACIVKKYFQYVLGIAKENILDYTNDEVVGYFFDNKFNPESGEIYRAVKPNKTEIFIYYSGHGIPSKTGDNVFLLPCDGKIETIERQGYSLSKFFNDLDAMGAKSVTVFIDACFSGVSRTSESYQKQNLVAMKSAAIKPKINKPWLNNPNFIVYSSSAFEETSLGYDPTKTGLFTYYLCAGLQGKADLNGDKKITSGELGAYIKNNVEKTSFRMHGLQSPQFNGNSNVILGEY